ILSHSHSRVVVGGFSAGALLALIKGACSADKVAAIIAINPALKIRQKSPLFSPMLDKWNKAMESISLSGQSVKWVENKAENPDINYHQIYISSLREFLKLQITCQKKLADIYAPLLIIQGSADPLVDPSGATEILHKVSSANKHLEEIAFKRHVIVRGNASIEVFKVVEQFLERL
ncbi:MAG: alpha/beta hydrolase, partial [Psychromonas sp.]|nr:alpha/beta hydrolase [Psychromonas sp.]